MRESAVYFVAWTVYYLVIVSVYLVGGLLPTRQAILTALLTVLPQAVFGRVVLRFCRRFPWPAARRARFFATHFVVAIAYGTVCAVASNAFFAAHRWLVEGIFRPYFLEAGVLAWQILMGGLLYAALSGIAYADQLLRRLRDEEARAARATALQSEAELRALRTQINPHFLFNTLQTLLSLIRNGDRQQAEEAVEQFGELMHYAIRGGEDVRLVSELEFVHNYLALEKLRLGERFRIEEQIAPEAEELVVPAFTLQPLVENAVRHGIAPRKNGGTLRVHAIVQDGMLLLSVSDDGPGRSDESASNGLGLRLVRERIEALYGERAGVSVRSESHKGFNVTVEIPVRSEELDAP